MIQLRLFKIGCEEERSLNFWGYGKCYMILWEDIKYIKPIIIIDEPQKIEGTKRNKSKSLKAIEELQPLFTLRYSATHKQLYNQIYKLDSCLDVASCISKQYLNR